MFKSHYKINFYMASFIFMWHVHFYDEFSKSSETQQASCVHKTQNVFVLNCRQTKVASIEILTPRLGLVLFG